LGAKLPQADKSFAYGIYLCAGLLTWNYFIEITLRGLNLFIDNASVLKKINFPRATLLVINFISASINFLIIFFIFIIFLLVIDSWPGWVIVLIIPVLLIQILFALSLGFILGIFNVFFRDTGHFFSMFIQFWFWCTPIVYPVAILPENIKRIIQLNPMYPIINAYQNIIIFGKHPDWVTLFYPVTLCFTICIAAFFIYKNAFNQIIDEL
jgi:lipopolysaccharide transport system permease protein